MWSSIYNNILRKACLFRVLSVRNLTKPHLLCLLCECCVIPRNVFHAYCVLSSIFSQEINKLNHTINTCKASIEEKKKKMLELKNQMESMKILEEVCNQLNYTTLLVETLCSEILFSTGSSLFGIAFLLISLKVSLFPLSTINHALIYLQVSFL